jgi:hypothetical protein
VDKYIKNDIGRTLTWKAANPLVGALMAPTTIPGHVVNIKGWDRDQQIYRQDKGERH